MPTPESTDFLKCVRPQDWVFPVKTDNDVMWPDDPNDKWTTNMHEYEKSVFVLKEGKTLCDNTTWPITFDRINDKYMEWSSTDAGYNYSKVDPATGK